MTCGKMVLAVAAAAALAGCNGKTETVSPQPPAPVAKVDRILMHVVPVALNWDGQPGPDGLGLAMQLYQYARPLPVTGTGSIEFTMYEGVVRGANLASARPFRTWLFTPRDLEGLLACSAAGWGYSIRLGWGKRPPTTSSVTLLARYTPPAGPPVATAPVVIPVRAP